MRKYFLIIAMVIVEQWLKKSVMKRGILMQNPVQSEFVYV